jgi:hypothetical protein
VKRTDATSDPPSILLVPTARAYQIECISWQIVAARNAKTSMTRSSSRTAPRTRYSLQDLLLATALVGEYLTALVWLPVGLRDDDALLREKLKLPDATS